MSASLITVNKFAERWDCSPKTVRRAIQRGDIKAVRLGSSNAIRIPETELKRALKPVTSLSGMAPIEDHKPVIPQSAATPAPPRKRVPAKTNTPRRNAASWRGGANA